ncbi:hypothetical protein [Moritella viscosa]|uniref:Uncharacterized protein n=1 Tax=Moritella viscosa TaxID=80854 RepID=A0A090I8H3_9GAMM|nr:hypothetical protein [Moritella viscosa]CED58165.1 putative uncharacterized protein [Moritella viscosa]SGY94175.1 Putative uncharacterized protein [Moritella viscosa]SGY99127.1 Putative uncharacterized protein [Moritella viscosa]SGY99489.1 Putative uncharacterized protein [Moritella viscosa]SGZ05514.1 Putative uncharacterized protein [Moritella viscosa]
MRDNSAIETYRKDHGLEKLTYHTVEEIQSGHFDLDKAQNFLAFQSRINNELLNHKVITANPYTQWFCNASLNDAQIKQLIVQFSVFSNQFLVAQLEKMLNAETLEEMRASKEILANEIGVVYKNPTRNRATQLTPDERDFGDIEGSIDGGAFHFKAAHFELLNQLADYFDIAFNQIGRRQFGSAKTLFFCDELVRLYGSASYATSTAASYAVENWAAAGFWDELVAGFNHYRQTRNLKGLPLTFFTWHAKLEANHANHTQEELEAYYFNNDVDEDHFIVSGNEMLDGVYTFWQGLDEERKRIH